MESLAAYQALKGCNSVLFQLPTGPNTIKQGWQGNVTVQRCQKDAASGGKKISGPLLVIQGKDDLVVDEGTTTKAVQETATIFPTAKIEYHILPNVTHASAMYAGQFIWMDWIAARFAGESVKDGYRSITHRMVRPALAQQRDANWHIQIQTESWRVL